MAVNELLYFAADVYNRYPAETVRLFVRPVFADLAPGHRVEIVLAPGFQVEDFALANDDYGQEVLIGERDNNTTLNWNWDWSAPSLDSELIITARVRPEASGGYLLERASLVNADGAAVSQQGLQILIRRYAESLRYMPEIFQREDFTNRFLMLLESFWKPMTQQINQIDTYFDPHLAPPEFVSWLGSWFGLALEDDLSDDRKRNLVAEIAPIYALKGTQQALEIFLNMYTGGVVEIDEYRDENFTLGDDTFLGYQIALGDQNRSHSFDIRLQIPADRFKNRKNKKLARQQYQRRIETLIDNYKPAQTVYNLEIQYR